MKTNPDDVAADLAELDQRCSEQRNRVHELKLQLDIANEILNRLYELKSGMEGLAMMRTTLDRINCEAEEMVKRAADVPF